MVAFLCRTHCWFNNTWLLSANLMILKNNWTRGIMLNLSIYCRRSSRTLLCDNWWLTCIVLHHNGRSSRSLRLISDWLARRVILMLWIILTTWWSTWVIRSIIMLWTLDYYLIWLLLWLFSTSLRGMVTRGIPSCPRWVWLYMILAILLLVLMG